MPDWLENTVTLLLLLTLLVMLLAAAALLSETSFWQRASLKPPFRIGAPVVYLKQEVATRPAADACDAIRQSVVNTTITPSSTIFA